MVSGVEVSTAFIASPSLQNLAERLAHRFEGVSVHSSSQAFNAERVVILCDGHGVPELRRRLKGLLYEDLALIAIDQAPETLTWAFEGAQLAGHVPADAPDLWARVEAMISGPVTALSSGTRPAVFVSHAVADERRIFPVIRVLREHYGLELFVCADSIPSGSAWRQEIIKELERSDVFLSLASDAANRSIYCAFEAGYAMGLGTPVRVVCLDGAAPPGPLQDVQGADVDRLLARKPWLEAQDGLLEAILEAVQGKETDE